MKKLEPKFCFGYVNFEMIIKYPNGYVEYTTGYMGLIFRGEIRDGDINWRVSTMKFWEQRRQQVKVQREKR